MRNPKKSQVSGEFLGVMTIMFFIFVVFATVVVNKINELKQEREWVVLREMAETLSLEIKTASGMEEGYLRTFLMPSELEGKAYKAVIYTGDGVTQNKTVLQVSFVNYSMNIPYTETLPLKVKGALNTSRITIRKEKGWVCLNLDTCP